MFGVDDIMLAAFLEAAPEMFAAEAAGTAAAGAEAAGAAAAGAEAAGVAGAAAGIPTAAQIASIGYDPASMVEGLSYNVANLGGPGAGSAGVQTAMQNAMQTAPVQGANIASRGIMGAPQPAGAANLQQVANDLSSMQISNAPLPLSSAPAAPVDPYQPAMLPPGAAPEAGREVAGSTPGMFDKFASFAKENPYLTGAGAYVTAYNLGLLDPRSAQMPSSKYEGPLSKYKLSENFKTRDVTPNVYVPRQYAEGGIASLDETPRYAKGGTLSDTLDYYKRMAEGETSKGATAPKGEDVGIYYDLDPDTRYQDALTAAQIRQAKVNKRANMMMPNTGVMRRPTPMGQINLAPPGAKARGQDTDTTEAARGGIMQAYAGGGPVEQMSNANAIGANTGYPMANIQPGAYATPYQQPISQNVLTGSQDTRVDPYTGEEKLAGGGIASLGGYAAGGNPRLLKGPGDGMSDDIPAMIGSKQPARLADGEFVVPADVVSHLGNGSTEAGAKQLHEMMDKVRRARTGNPKQGKQINPKKYMPK